MEVLSLYIKVDSEVTLRNLQKLVTKHKGHIHTVTRGYTGRPYSAQASFKQQRDIMGFMAEMPTRNNL